MMDGTWVMIWTTLQVRASLKALVVPVEATRPAQLLEVADSSAAIADMIGARLLADEAIACDLPAGPGQRISIYLSADAHLRPLNARAGVLAARLGLHHRALLARLRGDLLVTGAAGNDTTDTDVPDAVLDALTHLHNVRF
jgi:hypothetical protein